MAPRQGQVLFIEASNFKHPETLDLLFFFFLEPGEGGWQDLFLGHRFIQKGTHHLPSVGFLRSELLNFREVVSFIFSISSSCAMLQDFEDHKNGTNDA